MEWISVKDKLPDELQTVWACNNETKFVALACLTYYDGWLWAVSNGSIYSEDGKIISECELDDDYDFTHWMPLPELPCVSGSTFEQVIKLLDSMDADERMDVFAEYCTYCGDKDPSCQCWNDE